ncbi:MAG: recombinase [Planctomycetota bacterium]|nr:MAG: recombinase [Planctomycetota bacterium]REK28374.1 MAG: recombinase [Planctomycetota bacterium]REK48390.1 MAG: recombinase [Planctomycetota bacterium]
MSTDLSNAGGADNELARNVHEWWQEAAEKAEVDDKKLDLSGFDPDASLDERIAWALVQGLDIGTVYSRYSSKRQHSTADQVRTCVQHAAGKGIYCPPEYVCVDEAQRGYRARREGLDRMRAILKNRSATVLLVFKASRLYRQAFKGYQLIQQEVVEEGLRAISVTQSIDTADTKAWKMLFQVHGIVDDMVIEATADHVREGLKGLFARGYTVGALPVGYRRKELPEAPVTNRGLVRTVPEVDPMVADMIREHVELILGGMPIKQGWRKWVADGGPADPRSTKGYMSYAAYRRMLSRIEYTGRFKFGRKRNEFSTKRDYARQIEQPEGEVVVLECEELRILDDEPFFALQRKLAKLKSGPRGPKKDRPAQLWDLITELFFCSACSTPEKPVRFYQTGSGNVQIMQCKNGGLCPCGVNLRRKEAVLAVCEQLQELLHRDGKLIEEAICCAQRLDARGDDELRTEIATFERKIQGLTSQISDLYELAGQGTDDDRKEVMARVRSAQAERTTARHELCRLKQALTDSSATITPEAVREILDDFVRLLEDGAAGKLGMDAVYKAVEVIRRLIGGQIFVHVEPRPGRKRTNVRGTFRPHLLEAAGEAAGQYIGDKRGDDTEVSVWLRKPPQIDLLAERAYQLVDVEKLSYRAAAKVMQEEGHDINSGKVWQLRRRYYEMIGQPVPKRPADRTERP